MIRQAVIIISGAGPEPPSHLFGLVAGVPFLPRQVLGLKRLGITEILILTPPQWQASLARELAAYRQLTGTLQLGVLWPEPGPLGGEAGGCILMMEVQTLAASEVFAELTAKLPPAGGVTLGLLPGPVPVSSDIGPRQPGSRPTIQLQGDEGPFRWPAAASGSWQATGLVLFSAAAWQEWLAWPKAAAGPSQGQTDSLLLTPTDDFLAAKVGASRVREWRLEPSQVTTVARDEDLEAATTWLIAQEVASPVGEGILERAWNRRAARYLLPWFLQWPLTPNQITLLSFLVGLLAVWGFAHGSYGASVGAALLLPVILVLDCLDGAVARLRFQESRLGAVLDLQGDSVLNLLLFWGMVIGCYRATGQLFFLGLGLPLSVGYVACWWLTQPSPQASSRNPGQPQPPLGFVDRLLNEAVSRDFFYIILVMALIRRLPWLVVALAVGTNIFALLYCWRYAHGQD